MTFTSPLPSVDITTGMFRPVRPNACQAAPDRRLDDILRLLSAGHLDAAQRTLDESPPVGLAADIMQADITSRRLNLSVPDLVTLRERVEVTAPDDDLLVAWVAAITAERLAIDGDPVAFAAALSALQQAPDPQPGSLLADYTRARLLRLASLATLLLPTAQAVVQHGALHEQAIALLGQGLTAEANATDGVAAGSRILIHGERPDDMHRLHATRAAAGQSPALWATALDLMLGSVAVVRRDADLAAECFDRIEQSPVLNPRMTYLPTFGRAVLRLLAEGPTTGALGTLHRALDHCRPDPRWRYDALCHAAHLLLEQRSPHGPPVAATALEMPPNGPVDLVEREILSNRVRVFQRDHPGDDELFGLLCRLDGWGRRRLAGRQALHLAHDLADTHPDLARSLHGWGIERLPPAAECTGEERDLRHRPGDRPRPAPPVALVGSRSGDRSDGLPPLEVSVLGPELTVRVQGTPRVLARMEGLLVLYLALSHPGTMHVESIHDALWPEKAFSRRRLNTLVHRLRTALGPAGDAVRRTRDQVWLDEELCRADLAAYRTDLGASDHARVRAVASVRGNLCASSHPFEERLIDERARFTDEWLEHARSLIRAGAIEAHRLYRARAALDLLGFPLDP